jgi:hypothetical protein
MKKLEKQVKKATLDICNSIELDFYSLSNKMNNFKFEVGQRFTTQHGTFFTLAVVEDGHLYTSYVRPKDGSEGRDYIPADSAQGYVITGWWKPVVSPSQIWKELNEA